LIKNYDNELNLKIIQEKLEEHLSKLLVRCVIRDKIDLVKFFYKLGARIKDRNNLAI